MVVGGKGTALLEERSVFEVEVEEVEEAVEEAAVPFLLCCCCCWTALRVAAMRCPVGPSGGPGGPGTVRVVVESVTLERGAARCPPPLVEEILEEEDRGRNSRSLPPFCCCSATAPAPFPRFLLSGGHGDDSLMSSAEEEEIAGTASSDLWRQRLETTGGEEQPRWRHADVKEKTPARFAGALELAKGLWTGALP